MNRIKQNIYSTDGRNHKNELIFSSISNVKEESVQNFTQTSKGNEHLSFEFDIYIKGIDDINSAINALNIMKEFYDKE